MTSPAARGRDPWVERTLRLRRGGRELRLEAPRSTFSSGRIDAGTLLLLDHLPANSPRAFLDLGCGYGALGLPVAAACPESRGVLVDRDLLAVEFARRNAAAAGTENVIVLPSLDYGALPPEPREYDWILANVPARVGEKVMAHFLEGGARRLGAGGEIRIVIIAPLAGSAERAADAVGLRAEQVARTSGHVVLAVGGERRAALAGGTPTGLGVYLRDRISLELPERLDLRRPTDLADEPHRLSGSIPLIAGGLPRGSPSRVLCFRSGYGLVPALCLARYPGACVVAQDRDLLAAAFTAWNCEGSSERLRVEATIGLEALAGAFDVIVGELSSPLGPELTLREVAQARALLAPHGLGLVAALRRQWKEVLSPHASELGLRVIAERDPALLVAFARSR